MEIVMYKAASHIVAVGQGYKQKITEKGIAEEKVSVVMNGVFLDNFQKIEDGITFLKKYKSEAKFVCTYIGTIGMAHGLEVVLAAAEILQKRNINDIVFWIVGDGANKASLEKQANSQHLNNVHFTGLLPKVEISKIISVSDSMLVHLKGSELFSTVIPSKIFEFMAMNKPIIMGVKGEAREIVLNANAGVSMEPDTPLSLIDSINKIKKDQHCFTNGKEYVEKYFDRNILAEEMLKIVKEVV
jgi:colanic acid biosynthesis glycosyl transferase WcaI